jgi:hypothetical protein
MACPSQSYLVSAPSDAWPRHLRQVRKRYRHKADVSLQPPLTDCSFAAFLTSLAAYTATSPASTVLCAGKRSSRSITEQISRSQDKRELLQVLWKAGSEALEADAVVQAWER